jgi:hypothetical protein
MDWDKGRSRNNGLEDQEDRAKNSGNGPGAGGLGHEEGAGRVARRCDVCMYCIPHRCGARRTYRIHPSWEIYVLKEKKH